MGQVVKSYFAAFDPSLDIQCIDTGDDSETAERIWEVRNIVSDPFVLAYCDILSDVDMDQVMGFHLRCGKIGTMVTTPLRTSYGVVTFRDDQVALQYREKPILTEYWINAGQFIFSREVFDHWSWSNKDFSRGTIPYLCSKSLLACYKHEGFWSAMDTLSEHEALNETWKRSEARWARWLRNTEEGQSLPEKGQSTFAPHADSDMHKRE
jgi:glucose-1-phosphate cytidylyltransferase